jgi:hypothetical protein
MDGGYSEVPGSPTRTTSFASVFTNGGDAGADDATDDGSRGIPPRSERRMAFTSGNSTAVMRAAKIGYFHCLISCSSTGCRYRIFEIFSNDAIMLGSIR